MRENILALKSTKGLGLEGSSSSRYVSEVWTIQDIAEHMHMTVDAVRKIVRRDGFPSSIGNQYRDRRWLARDVRAYFQEASRTQFKDTSKLQIESNYEPLSIVFTN
jgi:hypothetical protein